MYIKTGKVKYVYQHLAILGPDSETAAAASECAGEQNKFWDYHAVLFQNQARGAFTKENLKRFAAGLGLDTRTFNACVDGDKYLAKIRAETEAAKKQGFTGTPAFTINGQQIVGAQPYEQFERVINIFLK